MRIPIAFLAISGSALAQSGNAIWLSPGFKLGSPISDSSPRGSFTRSDPDRWTGGPSIELGLPYRFSVEFNALFRTSHSNLSYPVTLGENTSAYLLSAANKTDAWDFPLLGKYRFQAFGLRPFVSAGYQWSRLAVTSTAVYQCLGPQGSCLPTGASYPEPRGGFFSTSFIRHGAVAGIGMEFGGGRVAIIPEVRIHRDGVTAMVGFRFGKH